jgi:hypothetical protein
VTRFLWPPSGSRPSLQVHRFHYKLRIYNHLQDSPVESRDGLFGPVSSATFVTQDYPDVDEKPWMGMDKLPSSLVTGKEVTQYA